MNRRAAPSRLLVAVLGAVIGMVVSLGLGGCPADPRQADHRPVATTGSLRIDQRELLSLLAQRGVARVTDPVQRLMVSRQLLEQMLDERLVLQAAEHAGISVGDDAVDREMRARTEGYPPGMFLRVLGAEQLTVDAYREGVRRRMTLDAFLRARLASLPPITDGELEAAYNKTLAQRQRPAQVRARQVLLRTAEEAAHVVEQIRQRSLTIEQAAQRFSQGMEASEGGDLGWFAPGDLPKVFDVCFILELNQVADPIQSEYGFHVFQVIDKREARIEPLSAVRDELYATLSHDQQAAAGEAIMVELRAQNPIKIRQSTLEAVVALLPSPPSTPIETVETGTGRPLDSHNEGADPIPPMRRE
jgi:peptidyl-prolyl cis-trans isomerase C